MAKPKRRPAHGSEDASGPDDFPQNGELSGADREEIARLAYQYYLERGGSCGSPDDDWLRAEREVRYRRSARHMRAAV